MIFYREKESQKSHKKISIDIKKNKTFREDQISKETVKKDKQFKIFFQLRKKPPTVIINDEGDPSSKETIKKKKKEKCNFVFLDKDLQLAKGLLFFTLFESHFYKSPHTFMF